MSRYIYISESIMDRREYHYFGNWQYRVAESTVCFARVLVSVALACRIHMLGFCVAADNAEMWRG
jgi:hypothetical protein